jgi:hypothetical protein
MCRISQSRIPPAAPATFENRHLLPICNKIGQQRSLLISDRGATRDRENEIVASSTCPQVTLTMRAVPSSVVRTSTKGQKGCDRLVGLQNDVSSRSARTADRAPARLATPLLETDDPGAPVTGPDMDSDRVVEH